MALRTTVLPHKLETISMDELPEELHIDVLVLYSVHVTGQPVAGWCVHVNVCPVSVRGAASFNLPVHQKAACACRAPMRMHITSACQHGIVHAHAVGAIH